MPDQPGRLIGRDDDIAQTYGRLFDDDVRLLTLVGAAGAGKTRLAIEVARLSAGEFMHGACFVDLAPIAQPGLLGTAIAETLELREDGSRPLIAVLKQHLAERHMLLVLDNFEQLVSAGPQLSELVQGCPGLKIMVTSRAAIRLRWEHVQPVRPLSRAAAVELFVDRAQRVDPRFALDASNSHAVEQVCVRLDGLPLAIELAAARTGVLPPEALLARLANRLDILEAANRDQPQRQRTLRAALDWSYDLLTAAEQRLFRRLGIFVGGFALTSLAEVCDADGALGVDPLDGLESLFDKSLIRRELAPGGSEPRFAMLETMREYALERLAATGELDLIRRAHAAYFLGGADVAVAEIKFSQQSAWLQSLETEHDNLRAALTWCEDAGEPELGLKAAGLLAWFWIVRGYVATGRHQLTSLLALADTADSPLRAEALRVIGSLALNQADYSAARNLFEASLAIRRRLGDPAGLLSALTSLGAVALQEGDHATAEAYFEEALAIQEAIGDLLGISESANNLANVAHERGDLERARALYERSLKLNQASIRYRQDVVLHNLGVVAQEQGELAEARKLFQDSVALKRVLGDTAGLALSLAKLGEVESSMRHPTEAHRVLSESLNLQRDLGDRPGMAFVLERFAITAVENGRVERGLRLAGAADALRSAIGAPLDRAARQHLERSLHHARGALRPEAADAAWLAGRMLSVDAAVKEALSPGGQTGDVQTTLLTAREREVAVLIAQGLTNRDIAQKLVVSERTAENHVQHVLNRLGLRSRAQVAAWAVHNGLTS